MERYKESSQSNGKRQNKVSALSIETQEKLRYLLNGVAMPNSLKARKSVEHFVGYFFEKFICNIFGGKRIDEYSKNPDIRTVINGRTYHFEVKAAETSNGLGLKYKQLLNFRDNFENPYGVLTYYRCKKPEKTFKEEGEKGFVEKMTINKIYILPIEILIEFYEQAQLSERDKIKYSGDEPYDTFKKTHPSTLNTFLVNKFGELNIERVGVLNYMGIDLSDFHSKFE